MITLLIPAYNEEAVIEKSVSYLAPLKFEDNYELLIVDDGSTDKTKEILDNLSKKYNNLRIISHEKNKGLGGALTTGFKNAKGGVVITMDADLTHPVDILPEMVNCIKRGYGMCLASRYVKGGGMKNVPPQRVLISKIVNYIFSLMYWTNIKDLSSGYRAYDVEKIRNIDLKEKGFAIQLEITVNMVKNKVKTKEIPFILVNRSIGESKFNFFKVVPK